MQKGTNISKAVVWRRNISKLILAAIAILIVAAMAAKFLIVTKPLEKADAIVVLSGAATFTERTHHAAEIFKAGRSSKIILTNDSVQSGWSTTQQRNPYYYERAVTELEQSGVPRANIEVLMQQVSDTHQEAELLQRYCGTNQIRSLLVVTSSYHSRRAFSIFSDVFKGSGVEIGIDPVPTGIRTPSPFIWWLYPSGWRMVPGEYLKIIYYNVVY